MWPPEMRELQTKATTQGKVEACTVGCAAESWNTWVHRDNGSGGAMQNDEEKIALMFHYNIYHD